MAKGREIKSVFDVSSNSLGINGVYPSKINGLYLAGIPTGGKGKQATFYNLEEAVRARRSVEKIFDKYDSKDVARAILDKSSNEELLSMTSVEEIQSVLDRAKEKKELVPDKQNVDSSDVKVPFVFSELARNVITKRDQKSPLSKIFSLILNRYDQSSNLNKLYFKSMSESGKTNSYMDKLIVDIFYSKNIEYMKKLTILKFSDDKYLRFDGKSFELVGRNNATGFTESKLKYIGSNFPIDKFQKVNI